MTKISEVQKFLESYAPPSFQESYDNSGLVIGDASQAVKSILITLDCTEEVVEEAIELGSNMIVCHHPIVFSGLKKINGKNYVERVVIKAIKNDISIFAAHTNLDSVLGGVNERISDKLNLKNRKILRPVKEQLCKLVTYTPVSAADNVRNAIFKAGAGHIGNYDSCSFNLKGEGTFRALEGADPYIGAINEIHSEPEIRIEVVFIKHLTNKILSVLKEVHPYEEVAYDIYPLVNSLQTVGIGMVGDLELPVGEIEFLKSVKETFNCGTIRYSPLKGKKVRRVAVCGGSGSGFLEDAVKEQADVFITADYKYHQFFDAENRIVIADIGHFESEQFTKDIFYEILSKKFPKFAVHLSKINTNPINYL